MKFTNLSNKLIDFVWGMIIVFIILVILGINGACLWVDLSYPSTMLSMFWLVLLPVTGFGINRFLGYFFDDEYEDAGYVLEGRSIHKIVQTPKYNSRKMFVCFIVCFLYVLLIVRFIFLFPFNITIPIIGIIGSIIGIIICFILGMSAYEQSSIKSNKYLHKKEKIERPKKSSEIRKTVTPKKQVFKFRFEDYPELLEKYTSFKHFNLKKYNKFKNEEEKNKALNEIDKAFESLALSIFNTFNEEKPELILKKTGEKKKWEDVINKPFEELSYTEKLILVRLLDRLYKYVLPNSYYRFTESN